jgi:hypothetical protein
MAELGDQQLQVRDHRLGACGARLGLPPGGALGQQRNYLDPVGSARSRRQTRLQPPSLLVRSAWAKLTGKAQQSMGPAYQPHASQPDNGIKILVSNRRSVSVAVCPHGAAAESLVRLSHGDGPEAKRARERSYEQS